MNKKPKVGVKPFHRSVNVMFCEAIIASTKGALLSKEEGHEPVFYVPFSGIYCDCP